MPISNGRRSDREKYIVYSCSLLVQKQLSIGDAHVVVELASDSLIPKFLRVTLDTYWRARIDLCMHGLVQPQTHFAYLSECFCLHVFCEECDIVQSDHAPQAGVAQGIFNGDLIRRRVGHQVELEEEQDEEVKDG